MSMTVNASLLLVTGPGGTSVTTPTGDTRGTPGTGGTMGTGGSPVTGDMTGGSTGWCSHIINSYSPTRDTVVYAFFLSAIVLSLPKSILSHGYVVHAHTVVLDGAQEWVGA